MSLIIKRLFKKLLHIYTLKCKYFDIIIYFRLDIFFYSILYLPFDKLFYEPYLTDYVIISQMFYYIF